MARVGGHGMDLKDAKSQAAQGASQPTRAYAKPVGGHVSLGTPLRGVLFLAIMAVLALITFLTLGSKPPAFPVALVAEAIVVYILVSGIRVAAQWERGMVLRLGRFE